jgi:hypothetical protein
MVPQFEQFDDNNISHCEGGEWWVEDGMWYGDSMWYVNRDEYEEAQEDLEAIGE